MVFIRPSIAQLQYFACFVVLPFNTTHNCSIAIRKNPQSNTSTGGIFLFNDEKLTSVYAGVFEDAQIKKAKVLGLFQ